MKTNNPYIAGIPDCYYSGPGSDLWVEYKFILKLPTRVPIVVNLSALQLHWLDSRHAEGRNVAVIVGTPTGGVVFRMGGPWEITTADFQSQIISRKELANWIATQTIGK